MRTCVTSPPYFGLRDYGNVDQIGLEPTPSAYVEKLVDVFREVKRILTDDGTLWLNLGDSYAGGGCGARDAERWPKQSRNDNQPPKHAKKLTGLKTKDLIGIPWEVAFALRSDGWYLRMDVIWAKPNPMPESVTDRPTKAHEYVFLLSKSGRYFYDHEAVKEDAVSTAPSGNGFKREERVTMLNADGTSRGNPDRWDEVGGKRNRRSVWTVTPKAFKGAHFATFPEELIEPCVLAGCPEKVCSRCFKPWIRPCVRSCENCGASVVLQAKRCEGCGHVRDWKSGREVVPEKLQGSWDRPGHETPQKPGGFTTTTRALDLAPSCDCAAPSEPGVVLDPFSGAGTTGLVARKHGRRFAGVELNAEYVEITRKRWTERGILPPVKLESVG